MSARPHNHLDAHYCCLDLECEIYLCSVGKKYRFLKLLGYIWYVSQGGRPRMGA